MACLQLQGVSSLSPMIRDFSPRHPLGTQPRTIRPSPWGRATHIFYSQNRHCREHKNLADFRFQLTLSRTKCPYNMAALFCAHLDDVTSPYMRALSNVLSDSLSFGCLSSGQPVRIPDTFDPANHGQRTVPRAARRQPSRRQGIHVCPLGELVRVTGVRAPQKFYQGFRIRVRPSC